MSDQVVFSLFEVVEMLRERIFQRMAELSSTPRKLFNDEAGEPTNCRGGAAIGVKGDGNIWVTLSEINPEFQDYWKENGRYAGYAAMKAITALQDEKPTTDCGPFNFSGAVHRGGIPRYLPEYKAWISIAFSGFESWDDEDIAAQVLEEFSPAQEVISPRPASFHP